ncbi:hypothetical protein [Clostridium sp. E02]|uniref:hypothetical protein n=1 Tax=Clostridium sp. E02 TaxID=2487134 RepID=UPI000F544A48|nr:hypothetical protein [Clostridium sp. E02]
MFKRYKKIFVIVGFVLSVIVMFFLTIIIPVILNKIYDIPGDFLYVKYNRDNILGYYGSVLTFIGTLSLGIITVYQNYRAQKKTDEVNALVIELQKKSMAMAEQQYKREEQNERIYIPKFELINTWNNGNYMNMHAKLKNISTNPTSVIKSVSFEVYNESKYLTESNTVKCKKNFLLSGDETEVSFNNAAIYEKTTDSNGVEILSTLKNINFVWKFQCDDVTGKTHYYKATILGDSNDGIWNVEKAG